MRRSETHLVREIVAELRARGLYARKIHSSGYQGAGLPDVHAIAGGRAVWLEVKRPGHSPTRIQARTLEELAQAGAIAGTVHSVDEALELLASWSAL